MGGLAGSGPVPWTAKRRNGINARVGNVFFRARLVISAMKTFLLRLFTWWNSQTLGTQLWTLLYGEFVGEDEFGNRYYRTRRGKIDPALGIERRWVTYNGVAEASSVPPGWHSWLHHVVDLPPTQEKTKPYPWEKPHRPNLTGTPGAHRPSGSTLAQGRRPKATGDYKAWTPGQ
jgi:NADH:ubiquinone oxidoreductase subunit